MKKRVFFAIDIPDSIKKQFEDFYIQAKTIEEVRWELPEKLHITLVFLGFVQEEQIQELSKITKDIATQTQQFTLTIQPTLHAFPSLTSPKVLWLPVEGDVEKLEKIKKDLEEVLKKHDFVFDERNVIHLTIGRVKRFKKGMLSKIETLLPKDVPSFSASGKTLFESTPSPKGSKYTILHYENFSN